MSPLARRSTAALSSLLVMIALPPPTLAESPYAGWRGQAANGSPYTAYRSGVGHHEVNRRPLDGSYRDTPYSAPTDWSGLYFGGHAAGVIGSMELSGATSGTIDTDGWSLGVHGGYTHQMGSFVAGLEFDTAWTGADGTEKVSGAGTANGRIDWLSSARLRLGYATGDYLFYATGGLSLASTEIDVTLPAVAVHDSDLVTGYAVGAGVEMKLTDSVSGRIEAIHHGFGDTTLSTPAGRIGVDLDETTIRAGLSLKFN